MPYFDFNNKEAKKYVAEQIKKITNKVNKVAPTSFPIPRVVVVDGEIDYIKKTKDVKIYVEDRSFYLRNHRYFLGLDRYNNTPIRISSVANLLIDFIMDKIEFDTNLVKFTAKNAAQVIGCKEDTIYECLKELENNDIIRFTDIKSVYIINHNAIFKGDLTSFVNLYLDIYGKTQAEVEQDIIGDYDYANDKDCKPIARLKIKKYING